MPLRIGSTAPTALRIGNSAVSRAYLGSIEVYSQASTWTPAALFGTSDTGYWYDPSDFSTLFQDAAGTTPVTAVGQPVGRQLDKSGKGNHRTQSTTTKRPILREVGGLHYLEFDGIDDAMATAAFNWTTDKATTCSGVIRSSTNFGNCYEFGSAAANWVGGFSLFTTSNSNSVLAANYDSGSSFAEVLFSNVSISQNQVFTTSRDRSATTATSEIQLRVNGASVTGAQNGAWANSTGNFGTLPMFFGARNGTSLYFSGRDYGHFGINRLLTTAERGQLESWMAAKTGVTL